MRRRRVVAGLVVALLLLHSLPVAPATIEVRDTCTLTDAINAANEDDDDGGLCPPGGSGADTLVLTGDVSLTEVDNTDQETNGANGLPWVTSEITVEGGGFVIERDPAADAFRIFYVAAAGDLTLNDVTLRNGAARSTGGAIFSERGSFLNLNDCTVTENSARNVVPFDRGGGIASRGFTTLVRTTVSHNDVGSFGGGINSSTLVGYGSLTLIDSTVTGNVALRSGSGAGGGIHVDGGPVSLSGTTVDDNESRLGGGIYLFEGELKVTNSTVSGNVAEFAGGIWTQFGETTLTNCTVAANAATEGGGIWNFMGNTTAANTILVGSSEGGNCAGNTEIVDLDHNFADDGTCGAGFAAIVPAVDVDLSLADNGGPTLTHALLEGSVAQDAAGDCGLATDQRGMPRVDGACDSGSFELVTTGACCTDGPGTQSECIVTSSTECVADGGRFLGAGIDCGPEIDCTALFVTMVTMSAEPVPAGVRIRWTTALESDTVGFRVLRQGAGLREKTLRPVGSWVPALGSEVAGGSYQVLDDAPFAPHAIHYFVEDIDLFGRSTRHGPIVVERTSREAAQPRAAHVRSRR